VITYELKKTIVLDMKRPCHHSTPTDESFRIIKHLIQRKLKWLH
jgi:hypothetical protein